MIYISIYPIEQGWFDPDFLKEGLISDIAARLISKVPVKYVNMVQSDAYDYFDFFHKEYHFLNEEDGRVHNVNGKDYTGENFFFGSDITVKEDVEKVCAQFKQGDEVKVYYDNSNHAAFLALLP